MDNNIRNSNTEINAPYGYTIGKNDQLMSVRTIHSARTLSLPQKKGGDVWRILSSSFERVARNNSFILLFCMYASIALVSGLNIISKTPFFSFSYPSYKSVQEKMYTPTILSYEADVITKKEGVESATKHFSQVSLKNYIIQSGDVLLHIARDSNLRIDTLVSWNKITDARRIWAGDTIIVPNKDGILHIVKRGESISSLAEQYNISAVNILDANDLASDLIKKGDELFIPNARMDEFELGLVLGTVFSKPTVGTLSSGYGYRISPITGIWSFHGGIDIANQKGTAVSTATYGVVSYVTYNSPVYGNMVIIRHPGGFQTLYAHLDKIYVSRGQSLRRGRTVGTMGNTGLSTGPHLHFSVILNGQTINPLRYIRLR